MIEKGRISALQLAILMNPTIIATAILLVPAITGKFAKQDMWLSPIWASSTGFLSVLIVHLLNKHYLKETVIQFSEKILGRIPGKLVGLVFLLFYLHISAIILREYGEFVVGIFLHYTPILIVIGSMTFVCSFAVRGGLEVIARSAQIFVPLIVILFLVIVILLIPDLKPSNIFPIMEEGVIPSLMGAVVPSSWFSEFFLISFLFPYLKDREKGVKWGIISVFSVLVILVITNIFSLFLFGGITPSFTYPVMNAARYANIADFLQHLESIVMAIWVAGTFVKNSVFYYALVLGTAQWLKLADYRSLVLPVGLLLTVVSIWSAPNLEELAHYLSTTLPFYFISVQMFIPIFLLFILVMRKKIRLNNIKNHSATVPESRERDE